MKKYEYCYERISFNLKFLGLTNTLERHRRLIDDYAQRGWRYAGSIPVVTSSEGRDLEFDLIFEKEIEE